ncbi:MAG: saccharopine dehydrogenase NADP-binding domain-containing protein [Anaerolineae bacterium]
MSESFLIYGATGYTGRLIAELAVAQSLRPLLAGRSAAALATLADELGLDYRVAPLADATALDAALDGVSAVLHAAGPFAHTAQPMVDACLRNRVHYLDITGEIAVFEALARRSAEAQAAGISLLPGVGFDVVPTDCLAAHLHARLPGATHLALAFRSVGSTWSRGTLRTMLEDIDRLGAIREQGKIRRVPAAWKTRAVDFGRGPVTCVTIPWGDVATAFYSTGIPNIEVYGVFPPAARRLLLASRWVGGLLASAPMQRVLKLAIGAGAPGPSADQRSQGFSLVWGEVRDDQGQARVSRLRTPEGYQLTALTSLAAVQRILAGGIPSGFQTPSLAFGADFIMQMAGVTRTDLA